MQRLKYSVMNFRVTEDIHALIKERSQITGAVNMSAYIRQLIYRDLQSWSPKKFRDATLTEPRIPSLEKKDK